MNGSHIKTTKIPGKARRAAAWLCAALVGCELVPKACAKPGEGAGAVGKACFQKMNGSCGLVGLGVAVIVSGMNGSDAAWLGAFVRDCFFQEMS